MLSRLAGGARGNPRALSSTRADIHIQYLRRCTELRIVDQCMLTSAQQHHAEAHGRTVTTQEKTRQFVLFFLL
eukprot:446936-Pyramimonas_sp.AAC.1